MYANFRFEIPLLRNRIASQVVPHSNNERINTDAQPGPSSQPSQVSMNISYKELLIISQCYQLKMYEYRLITSFKFHRHNM